MGFKRKYFQYELQLKLKYAMWPKRIKRVRFVLPEDIYTEPGVDKKKKGNFTKLSKPKTIASILKKFK